MIHQIVAEDTFNNACWVPLSSSCCLNRRNEEYKNILTITVDIHCHWLMLTQGAEPWDVIKSNTHSNPIGRYSYISESILNDSDLQDFLQLTTLSMDSFSYNYECSREMFRPGLLWLVFFFFRLCSLLFSNTEFEYFLKLIRVIQIRNIFPLHLYWYGTKSCCL